MKKKSLIEHLSAIPEFRRKAGLRHPLGPVLLMVIMAKMSGFYSYRSIGDFIERHREALVSYFEPKKGRLPSFLTVRQVLMRLDYSLLYEAFYNWAIQYVNPESLISIDGKSIRSTLSNPVDAQQDFIALVSAYCTQRGEVVAAEAYHNAKESEVAVVKRLLKKLDLPGQTYTLDALHCKKNFSPNRGSKGTLSSSG